MDNLNIEKSIESTRYAEKKNKISNNIFYDIQRVK